MNLLWFGSCDRGGPNPVHSHQISTFILKKSMAMPLDRILEKNYSAPRFSPNSEILASALQCPLPRRPSYIMNRSLSNSSEGRSAANRTYIHALLLL